MKNPKTIYKYLMTFIISALGITILILYVTFDTFHFSKKIEGTNKTPEIINTKKLQNTFLIKEIKKIEATIQDDISSADLKDQYKSTPIRTVNSYINHIYQLRNNVFSQELRNILTDHFLKDDKNIKIISRALTDNRFARRQFGQNQAKARLYGIYVLKRLGEHGEHQHLENCIKALSKKLINGNNINPKNMAGISRDLEDLIESRVDIMSKNDIENLESFLLSWGYHSKISNEYYTGIFRSFNKKYTKSHIGQIFTHLSMFHKRSTR